MAINIIIIFKIKLYIYFDLGDENNIKTKSKCKLTSVSQYVHKGTSIVGQKEP